MEFVKQAHIAPRNALCFHDSAGNGGRAGGTAHAGNIKFFHKITSAKTVLLFINVI